MKICAKCNNPFEEGIAYCPNDGSRLTTVSKLVLSGHAVPSEVSEQVAREEHGEDLIDRTIAGRYTIRKRLGEGGMGVVYSGVDTRLEKDVAIKVLKEDFAHRSEVVTRFEQEAKSAARIKHENVLDVTDWGRTENGSFYIAMELLVGTDLADALQKDHTIEPGRAVNIAIQVTRALAAAHAKGIVHRDLKPENVFLVASDAGREIVKIVDFGIAQMKDLSGEGNGNAQSNRKLTRTGMIFGTPEYMSPEQAAGKSIDHRVDVYAVGVILYEMLAGRVPFVGDTFMGVLTQHMFEPPPPITAIRPDAVVQPDLEAVILRALAKDPEQRYASMSQLADDLSRVRDGERPSASTTFGAPGTGRFNPARPSGAPGATNATPVVATRSLPTGDATAQGAGGRRTVVTIAIVASVVVLGGAAVVYKTLGHERPPPITGDHTGTTARPDHAVGVGGGNVAIGPHAAVTADAAVAIAPAVLHVHVASTPIGARVEVADSDLSCGATPCSLACAATPCTLTVPRGREIHLRAGDPRHAHAELAVLPDHDGQDVTIALGATGATVPTHPNGGGHPSNAGTGTTVRRGSRCRPGQLTYLDHDLGMYVQCGPQ